MTDVASLLHSAARYLRDAGVPSPELDAALLLAHVLGVPRHVLALEPGAVPANEAAERFLALLSERGRRRPLSHLLGEVEFWSLPFRVTDATLAPRPETELLVEHAARFAKTLDAPLGADVGTGTGCIAIALLVECPALRMHGVDVSPGALDVARENAARHLVDGRLRLHEGSYLAPVAAAVRPGSLDLVVSNPPYVRHAERATVDPEVLWEPAEAVFCDGEPVEVYATLAAAAAPLVRAGGRLFAELPGDDPAPILGAITRGAGWRMAAILPDLAGHPRLLVAERA